MPQAATTINYTTSAPGNFTLAHNLGMVPVTVIFEYTSTGEIWFQTQRYDSTNLYLVASGAGVSVTIIIYADCGC